MTIDHLLMCSTSLQCQAEPLEDFLFILFVLMVGLAGECSIFIYLHHIYQKIKFRWKANIK